MAKNNPTASGRPVAPQVEPNTGKPDTRSAIEAAEDARAADASSPTDATSEAQTAPTDAPKAGNEPSKGGSVPRTQDGATLYPDQNKAPAPGTMEAAAKTSEQKADPLLPVQAANPNLAGATDDRIEVKTTGAFLLMDPMTGIQFEQDKSNKTPRTQWVQDQIDAKRLVEA
jgi:hypothetical protein